MKITWSTDVISPGSPGEILGEAERSNDGDTGRFVWTRKSLLIDHDWDFPGTAQTFGWSLREVQTEGREVPCDHDATDGTVPCPDCGLAAGDFISAAYDWLRAHHGATAEDPGYFGG